MLSNLISSCVIVQQCARFLEKEKDKFPTRETFTKLSEQRRRRNKHIRHIRHHIHFHPSIRLKIRQVLRFLFWPLSSSISSLFFTVLSFLSLPSSLNQLLKKFSSCIALPSDTASPSSFGNAPFPQDFFSGKIPQSFLRHKTFHFKIVQEPLILLSRDSSHVSFNPSSFLPPLLGPSHLPGLESSSEFCHTLGNPSVPACNNSSVLVPFFASRIQNTFYTISGPLSACPLFSPGHGHPRVVFTIFPNSLTRISVMYIFLASS